MHKRCIYLISHLLRQKIRLKYEIPHVQVVHSQHFGSLQMGNKHSKFHVETNPMPSIFSTKMDLITDKQKSALLVSGYCRLHNLPTDITICCIEHFSMDYAFIDDFKDNNQNHIIIPDSQEYIFGNTIKLKKNTTITATGEYLRITIRGDLHIGRNASILSTNHECKIVLQIHGNCIMDPFAKIYCQNQGDIYIYCNELKMDQRSKIQIYQIEKDSNCKGFIYIRCVLTMDISGYRATIFGAGIQVVCPKFRFLPKVYMQAIDGQLKIRCKDFISVFNPKKVKSILKDLTSKQKRCIKFERWVELVPSEHENQMLANHGFDTIAVKQ
eukprot:184416_1